MALFTGEWYPKDIVFYNGNPESFAPYTVIDFLVGLCFDFKYYYLIFSYIKVFFVSKFSIFFFRVYTYLVRLILSPRRCTFSSYTSSSLIVSLLLFLKFLFNSSFIDSISKINKLFSFICDALLSLISKNFWYKGDFSKPKHSIYSSNLETSAVLNLIYFSNSFSFFWLSFLIP